MRMVDEVLGDVEDQPRAVVHLALAQFRAQFGGHARMLGEEIRQPQPAALVRAAAAVVGLAERFDQVAQDVERVVADAGGHLQVGEPTQPARVQVMAERPQQVRLARAAFPAQAGGSCRPGRPRAVAVRVRAVDAVHRAGKHVARPGVDFLHVEGVRLPDVIGVNHRVKDLRTLPRAEGQPARVVRVGRGHGSG